MKLSLGFILAFLTTLFALACTRDNPVAPVIGTGPSFEFYVEPPGDGGHLCFSYLDGPAFPGNWWDPRGNYCRTELHASPFPYLYEDAETGPHDIVGDFSEPISNVVITPLSIWECGSNPGSVTVYTSSGESATFAMPQADESQCGQKVDVYPGQQCTPFFIQRGSNPQAFVVPVQNVTRVVIRPVSPLKWHYNFYTPDGGTECGLIVTELEASSGGTYIVAFREFDVDNADLVLNCDQTSVIRGESINCTAVPVPSSATLHITEWRFDSDLGFGAVRPADAQGRTWGGKIATAGTMSLTARVGTRTFTRSLNIAVTPRNWTGRPVGSDIQEEPNNHLPLMVRADSELGDVHQTLIDRYEAVTEVIADGPNQGLAYVTDLPFIHQARIHINRQALAAGSAFWKHHPMSSPHGGTCTRSYIQQLAPLLLPHEGPHLEPNSHTWFFHQYVEQANLGTAVEGLLGVGSIGNDNRNVVSDLLKVVINAADAADQADAVNKVHFTCSVNYFK